MDYFWIFSVLFIFINTVISIITVFSDRNRDIAAIWAWLLVLIILPGFGLIIYVFLGRKIAKEDIFNLQEQAKVGLPEYLSAQEKIAEEQLEQMKLLDYTNPKNKKYEMAEMLMEVEQPPLSSDNSIKFSS